MQKKNEIDLNLIDESGQTFDFTSEELSELSELEEVSIHDENNQISLKITPIGSKHFEVKAQIKLKRPLNCSRCGEGFKTWFDEKASEYLSLEKNEEGEDRGFLLLDSSRWNWAVFIRESVELETPYQTYKYGEKCLDSCPHYENAVEKGWITAEDTKNNAFAALEKIKGKLN